MFVAWGLSQGCSSLSIHALTSPWELIHTVDTVVVRAENAKVARRVKDIVSIL